MNLLFNDPHGTRHAHICKIYGLDQNYNAKEAGDAPSDTMNWCALPEKGQYPTDTPERTVVSWCHANYDRTLQGDTKGRVLYGIKKAADWWGIELPKEKVEQPKAVYSFKVATENGDDTYTVRDSLSVAKYADLISKNASYYSYDTRRQVAQGLLDAPDNFKAGLTPDVLASLELAAGRMMASANDVKAACDIRASYAEASGHPDIGNDLRELGDMAKGDFVPVECLVKTASAIDLVDRSLGLTVYFKDGTLLPAEQSFAGIPYSHVKQAFDDTLPLNNGRTTTRSLVLSNRSAVETFFSKIAGEDLSKASNEDLCWRVANMDELETDAFDDITKLCM